MPIPYFPNSNWWSLPIMASVMTVVAIAVAFYIAYKEARRKKLNLDMLMISALWGGLFTLVGVRLAYFITPGQGFLNLNLSQAHSWGGILLGFLGLVLYAAYKNMNKNEGKKKSERLSLFAFSDVWVFGVAVGTFFFRIGCYLAHCIEIGKETGSVWAVFDNGTARYPINLYYSLSAIFVFIVLIEARRSRYAQKNGFMTMMFFAVYSLPRVLLDFFRVYDITYWGFGFGQLVYLIMLLFGVRGLIKRIRT